MSSDEVKVKFVADTKGLENVPLPTPKAGTTPTPTPGTTPTPTPGQTPPPRPPTPPPIPPTPTPPGGGGGGRGRGRAALPWEAGWSKEAAFDITSGLADALSGVNLLAKSWEVAKFAAEKYVEIVKGGIEYAQKIEKVSRVSGLSVEEVQKYGYAAQMSGVNFDTFANSMANANKELGKLSLYGGTSVVALSRLGINVDSVKNHSVGAIDVLKKMADAYKKHAETAEMAALGNQLFGGSFKDMIPMLRNGSAEIERLASMAPLVNSQTVSASAAFGRSTTQIVEATGARAAEAASGYSSTERGTSQTASAAVKSGEMTPEQARDALLNPANRSASRTIENTATYAGAAATIPMKVMSGDLGGAFQNAMGLLMGTGAEAKKGEGIRGAGEDTRTVRDRFIAMRGGNKEKLSEEDKKIVASFDEKIKEEGKMNLQSGVFQAASKMQQVGGGDVLSAISRVDLQEKMADSMDKLITNNPFGGGKTPPPADTNGPVAK